MAQIIVVEAGNGRSPDGKVLKTGADNFNTYLTQNMVAIGWLPGHDLTGLTPQAVDTLIDTHVDLDPTIKVVPYSEQAARIAKNQSTAKRAMRNFLSAKPGDLVLVPGATARIYGLGVITSGYKYTPGKMDPNGLGNDYRNHFLEVTWLEWSRGNNNPSYLERAAFLALGCTKLWPTLGFVATVIEGNPEFLTKAIFWPNIEQALLPYASGVVPVVAPVVPAPVEEALVAEQDADEDDVVPSEPEPKVYTGDPFTVNEAGNFVGCDGFIVPKNFDEFIILNPGYVRRWVQKRTYKNIIDDDVLDWESELMIHLRYLPERSKARTPGYNGRPNGCKDVIESFNPILQYGASAPRFYNYIKKCLGNRFITLESKRQKNPVCRANNYSLGNSANHEDSGGSDVIDDAYIHRHSESMNHSAGATMTAQDNRVFIQEFIAYVKNHDPGLVEVIDVIANTGTFGEARGELNMDEKTFYRSRNRLKVLRDCFLANSKVPSWRKQYRRQDTTAPASEATA
jgi:hypothetical protein